MCFEFCGWPWPWILASVIVIGAVVVNAEVPGSQWRRQIDERDTSGDMATSLAATKSNPFVWWIGYRTFVDDAMTYYHTL